MERAGPLIALRTLDLPLMFMWQELFFEHSSSLLLSSIGATIIVLGSLNITLNKYFRSKKGEKQVPHIELEECVDEIESDEMLSDALQKEDVCLEDNEEENLMEPQLPEKLSSFV